ncbi:MAG: drug resistance transporter, EmrB/QacA subfamily [Bryobacterales bacterium]|nr:drug resistance transporter, EmrB/QacA subfamily [Bryobacterales bacterium]
MEVLDTSIANVALPHIAGNLSAGQDESTWVLTSYLVANAVILPISGWLSTIIGRKRFYMMCVTLFTISSFLCGLAPNLGMLIFFRVLQGLGGGGLAPSEQAILADTFEPAKRGMAFAVYGIAVVTAPAIGPTLGGWITDNFDWRWIFFINIPVGALSLFFTSRLVEDPPYLRGMQRSKIRIDYIGLGLIALGLASLQIVLDKGEREDWFSSRFIVLYSIVAAASLILAAFWEWNHDHPVIEVKLLKQRSFLISNIAMFMLGIVLFGTTLLVPQMLQELFGYTAQEAGMVLSPGGIVVILLLPSVGILISRVDARYLISLGFLITSLGLFHLSRITLDISFGEAVWARVYQAAGLAFLFIPIQTVAYIGMPREKSNAISGMTNLSRNIGGSVGISLVTTLLARRTQYHQSVLAEHTDNYSQNFRNAINSLSNTLVAHGAAPSSALHRSYGMIANTIYRQAAMESYLDVFRLLAIGAAVLVPCVFIMKKARPSQAAVH